MDPYQRLAFAVLLQAVEEAHRGDMAARSFLDTPNMHLTFWCAVVGVRPATIRRAGQDPTWPTRLAQARAVYLSERSGRSETA